MSDVVTLARMARESLSQGLKALQGDPNVPRHLVELAQPVAQAMGLLHQIERTGGVQLGQNAQAALSNLQTALGQLQAQPPQHPAVAAALEAVAGALASVHTLVRMAAAPMATAPTAMATAAMAPTAMAPAPPKPQTASRPKPTAPAPVTAAQPPAQARAPQGPPPMPVQPGAQGPAGGTRPAGRAEGAQPAATGAPVTAELGAHSASNFYKGLSGNDIIDHGGLFVSTYKLPKIGQPIRLKVALPGGYEFEAGAIVRWRREPSDEGNDAPPGFGAQFTDIAVEARQLVYRYVRNREPLFHDDL
ncbi:MAG TPA: PilZ domain-containing protein [Polyangiaceae bacterium]|nr:PilZ domain-containing protein [Polyangiaceae bacterium]